ncbi:MAG TPA: hypothetical protein VM325_02410 [Alphaproteobacteria bacterium]|nr:hypothetical protein [Alphaproteobacteria bacterium]
MTAMNLLLILFVTLVMLAAGLGALAIWAPRRALVRGCALVVVAALLPLGYAGFSSLLSRPKPASLEWARRSLPEAKIAGSYLVEGKAIYLWLIVPGSAEPRFYAFPWSRKLAQQLTRAQQAARKTGVRVRMRRPFGELKDMVKSRFRVEGHRPLPPKQHQAGRPQIYQHPGEGG